MRNYIQPILIFICFIGFTFLVYECSSNVEKKENTVPQKKDSTVYLNHSDTARYVGINTCRLCHQNIYNTFINTGMGQSFDVAGKQKSSANFNDFVLVDKASNFNYKAFWQRDSLWMFEFRKENKDTIYKRQEKVDYIIGSGQHTNSHLQNVNGYFNQMPMTFYTQKGEWHLPPGFENGHNSRFTRKIGLECMSCHNAYPQFVLGSENKYSAVPNGIDCERCHGPGSIHVQQRSSGSKIDTSKYIDYSIVNPAKLPIDLQFDICQRCHLQGNAVLKENKSFYDFKPGMKLSDYISVFLPKYKNGENEFIMASHAERLKQSACFIQSFEKAKNLQSLRPYKEALTCVSCHNPHISVRQTNKNVFNDACRHCHENNSSKNCSAPQLKNNAAKLAVANCVSCHMPSSGSTDIPHVSVHDHYIRKPINKNEFKKIKEFVGLFSINEKNPDRQTRALAYINQYEKFELNKAYLDSAEKLLVIQNNSDIFKNLHALVQLHFIKGDYLKIMQLVNTCRAEVLLDKYLTKQSYNNSQAWTAYRIGEAFANKQDLNSALKFHLKANELAPFVPDFKDKLANVYADLGDNLNARKYYQEALKENPKLITAITNLGYLNLREGNVKAAEGLYNRGLKLEPDYEPLLLNLAGLLNYQGNYKVAKKTLKQILKLNPKNEQARQILNQMEAMHL